MKRYAQELKWCSILFLAALGIRLVVLIPVALGKTSEIWDAFNYFDRAIGFRDIFIALGQGHLPSVKTLARAYSDSWPPLQAFLLSLPMLAFGSTLTATRSLMTVLSAATTPLMYLVTRKLSDQRAALAASIIFVVYPSFIFYSHLLWSETTYIFLFFLALYLALKTMETPPSRRKVGLATVTGFLLGCSTLVRAAGLISVPIVALWTGWRSRPLKQRVLPAAVILISAGAMLVPWEIVLYVVEGEFVTVARSGDLNLYDGNNPWLMEGDGEPTPMVKRLVIQSAYLYSLQHGVSQPQACRALALQEITQHPSRFLRRGFYKVRILWSADFMLLRHILMGVYPPMSNVLAGLIWLYAMASFFAFLAMALWGLWNPEPALHQRVLIIVIALAATVQAYISTGQPRFGIPLLAVLTPAAGHGLAHLSAVKTARARAIATVISIALAYTFIYGSFPFEYGRIISSSHYLTLVRQLDRWMGREMVVSDRLLFRTTGSNYPGQVVISVDGDDYEFADLGTRTYSWNTSTETGVLNLVARSAKATEPPRLQVSAGSSGPSRTLLLSNDAWQTWKPSGLLGIEYMWSGSSQFPIDSFVK
jgi:Dolichyl-phosphate-mannose-protein mannosyltransferase